MITDGHVVSFKYTLRDDDGTVLDESQDKPVRFLFGGGELMAGLEQSFAGKSAGDRFDAIIPPDQAYGPKDPTGQFAAPRNEFPAGLDPETGMMLTLQDETGAETPVWVINVTPDTIVMDRNHPLAGVTLRYDVEVVDVRKATDDELNDGCTKGCCG